MVSVISSAKTFPGTDLEPRRIGDLLVQAGVLTDEDVGRVIALQTQDKVLFGEAALKLGLLSARDIELTLARQYSYPYSASPRLGESGLLFAADNPSGAQAEAVRTLRSQLTMRWLDEAHRAFAVVAPRSAEGASVLAANLAIAFAQLGESTLLIDADMRSPQQHHLFGLDPTNGLAGILGGRINLQEALSQIEPFHNLSVLCAGTAVPNAQELLCRNSFAYLMNVVTSSFDVVILDAPALLQYADALIIATAAQGCIIAARRNVTRMADVESAQARLAPCKVRMIGAVLHDLPPLSRAFKPRARRMP